MQNSNIIIFSRPIRSGKTIELFKFIQVNKNCAGVLTPDNEQEIRVLYDIAAKQYFEFELPANSKKPSQAIGKFLFSDETFQAAKKIMEHPQHSEWFIIDEIGKLEILQHKGFEPAVSNLIEAYKKEIKKGKLLLVIRDTLLDEAKKKFVLHDTRVIHSLL